VTTARRRSLAVILLVALPLASGGVPMCVAAVARLVRPCEMHAGGALPAAHQHGHDAPAAAAGLVRAGDTHPCHGAGVDGAGCLGDGACPAAGVGALTRLDLTPAALPPVIAQVLARLSQYSHSPPAPPSPPPQL